MQFPELWTDNCADLLRAFNNQGVQYLLIGSMAKSHYCRQPRVNDIDLMINPTPENAGKVLSALRAVENAADLAKLTDEKERELVEGASICVYSTRGTRRSLLHLLSALISAKPSPAQEKGLFSAYQCGLRLCVT